MAAARTILALAVSLAAPALAQEQETPAPPMNKWSFAGPFGKYDRAQLQRGLKVYREVCQVCHGLKLVAFRTLADPGGPGFTIAQATAIAAEYQVKGEPDDQGEVKDRPGRLAARLPRLPAPRVHQRDRLQPDGRDAADAPGEVHDARAVDRRACLVRPDRRAGRERLLALLSAAGADACPHDRPARDAAVLRSEAKDAFAQCEPCHRDSYRRRESGQRDGMSGQRAHDVGVRE